jgi:hypothetical protein
MTIQVITSFYLLFVSYRPTRMSASTDADVCIDRCELRTCYFYFSTPSSLPTLMKAAIALSSCSRV